MAKRINTPAKAGKKRATQTGTLVGVRLQPDLHQVVATLAVEFGLTRPEALRNAFENWAIASLMKDAPAADPEVPILTRISRENFDRLVDFASSHGTEAIHAAEIIIAERLGDDGEENYNRLHRPSGTVISGSSDGALTVGDVRDAIANLPDDAQVVFGTCEHGDPLQFYRFKSRGEDVLGIEFG